MSFVEAIFFLLCFLLSFHACNGRVLGSESEMVYVGRGYERQSASAEKVKFNTEERILQEQNAAAQEYDSDDSNNEAAQEYDSKDSKNTAEDVVVMDYAQPHRKPPIHNEEN